MSRILIVEDEVAIADLEKDYLELSGFEVEIENDGKSGLERALNEDFDLFILDLMLPEVARRRIRRSLWYLPRRMILIKSVDWVWEQMIMSPSHFHQVNWLHV